MKAIITILLLVLFIGICLFGNACTWWLGYGDYKILQTIEKLEEQE